MPLSLVPYDPDGERRRRAQAAVDLFTKEYNAVVDPGVHIRDYDDRERANRKRWLKKKGGR